MPPDFGLLEYGALGAFVVYTIWQNWQTKQEVKELIVKLDLCRKQRLQALEDDKHSFDDQTKRLEQAINFVKQVR